MTAESIERDFRDKVSAQIRLATEGVNRLGAALFGRRPREAQEGLRAHGKGYLTRRRRDEEGDGGGSLTGGAIPSA